jgi:hypothetical protein
MLSVMLGACQHFFKFFTNINPEPVFAGQRLTRKASAFSRSGKLRCDHASKILREAAPLAAEAGEPGSEISLVCRMRASPSFGNDTVTISQRMGRKAEVRESRGSVRIFLKLSDAPRSPFRVIRVIADRNALSSTCWLRGLAA